MNNRRFEIKLEESSDRYLVLEFSDMGLENIFPAKTVRQAEAVKKYLENCSLNSISSEFASADGVSLLNS